MKLEAKKSSYKLPWIGKLIEVFAELSDGMAEPPKPKFQLIIVGWPTLVEARARNAVEVLGTPHMAALKPETVDGETLELYPTPDRDGRLIVRYYPQLVEA